MGEPKTEIQLKQYQLLFENSLEGIFIFGSDGTILEANLYIADMVGFEINEMVGRNVFSFILPEEKENSFHRVQNVKAGQADPVLYSLSQHLSTKFFSVAGVLLGSISLVRHAIKNYPGIEKTTD